MDRIAVKGLSLTAATLLLAACGANHHSIFRYQKIDPTQSGIITVDAKQRAILVGGKEIKPTKDGTNATEHIRQFCSEPSPDVFTVIAQAMSAGGTFGKSADPKSVELALNAAFSSAEQGSTIPRTQTVNMLRELMFRTCERYLNGGIGDLELPIQAARDQRLMVSILAIESLTGAVTPKPVVIGANANASGGASGAEAAVRLDDAYKALQAKTAAQQSRQNEYNDTTTDKKHCEQIAEAVAKKEEDTLPKELKDKRAKCETATSALAAAKTDTANSATHYATLKDTAASGGIPVATTTALMVPKADGGIDRAHGDAVSDVAKSVENIVMANMNQDEFAFLCMKVLDPNSSKTVDATLIAAGSGIKETCTEYINSQIEKSIAINSMIAMNIDSGVSTREDIENAMFEKFWSQISTNGKTADPAQVSAMKNKFSWWPACFSPSGKKVDYLACFSSATGPEQRRLSR
jgi:hypothetical protein